MDRSLFRLTETPITRALVTSQTSGDPAVVFFPTNEDSECMDGTSGPRRPSLV